MKDVEKRRECQDKFSQSIETCHGDMEKLEENQLHTCREICVVTTGRRGRERETWWLSESAQEILKMKKKK